MNWVRKSTVLLVWTCLAICGCTKSIEFPDLRERLLMSSDDAKNPGNPFTKKDCPDCRFYIVNKSGQIWTDFHLEMRLGKQPDGTFGFMPEGGGFDGQIYEGPGTGNLSNNNHTLDVIGLNVPNGETYDFTVDIGDLELEGTWELYGWPTVK
jgi:hypothetical protein